MVETQLWCKWPQPRVAIGSSLDSPIDLAPAIDDPSSRHCKVTGSRPSPHAMALGESSAHLADRWGLAPHLPTMDDAALFLAQFGGRL